MDDQRKLKRNFEDERAFHADTYLHVLIFLLACFTLHLFYIYIIFLLHVGFHRIYLSCNFLVAVHKGKGTVLIVKGVVDFHVEKASRKMIEISTLLFTDNVLDM